MKTKRLYREDVNLKESKAVITDIIPYEKYVEIILDQSMFFPEGGGQSSDIGLIGNYKVSHVVERIEEENDLVIHVIDDTNHTLQIGDEVEISIDWAHRFDNMQRHLGEHILSGAFHKLYGGVNRGFHMGDDYITIDISMEDNPEYKALTFDMAKEAELLANSVIWSNLPVKVYRFDTREEAEKMPLRKALAFDEDISIVLVGTMDDPADCVACCGTHPTTTGQVGLIKIYKVEVNKKMFRVYFECGQRAFRQYQEKLDVLTALEVKLSAGTHDVLDKFAAKTAKEKDVRNSLYQLKKSVISKEAQEIEAAMTSNLVRRYDVLEVNDILDIGRTLEGKIIDMMFLVHEPSNTVLLFSDKHDCGKLVKDNASIYNGKGGGNKTSARAIFGKAEYTDIFIDLITKHLR